jgi:hypothetical protein
MSVDTNKRKESVDIDTREALIGRRRKVKNGLIFYPGIHFSECNLYIHNYVPQQLLSMKQVMWLF